MHIYYEQWLKDRGVDIHDPNYKQSEAYMQIKDDTILGSGGFMTMEQYIERHLLEADEVAATYDSIYDMGNPCELTESDCADNALAQEIIRNSDLGVSIKQSDLDAEAEELVKKLHRSGGLLDRLRLQLNFDVALFDSGNLKHRAEICKIIYFIYMLENSIIPEMLGKGKKYYNVVQFLSNPSMESIDNTPLGWYTYSGQIIRFIKDALEKELSREKIKSTKNTTYEITSEWEQVISNAYMLSDFMFDHHTTYELDGVINSLNSEPEQLSQMSNTVGCTLPPIETFYLKIMQHEFLGNVTDIAKVNAIANETTYDVPEVLVNEMIKLNDSPFDIDRIDQYVEQHAAKIARYVYLDSIKNKKEAVRKIKDCKDKVRRWLDFCVRSRPMLDVREIANELQIISLLQAIILDDPSETFDYVFFNYQDYMKHRPQVQGALKNDKRTVDALQNYWVRKVTDRWRANIGRYPIRAKVRELENACDGIIMKILARPNLDEMIEMHRCYMEQVSDELSTAPEQVDALQQLQRYFDLQGFRYADEGFQIRKAFLYPPEIPGTLESFMILINGTIKEKNNSLKIEMPASVSNGKTQLLLEFTLVFDYANHLCTMSELKCDAAK